MAQDLCKIGIIGAGPAGCCCAYFCAKNNTNSDITVIDYDYPLKTILPTGGGKCNLTHSEFDFKELAKNYPRGEKFLYSVFSRFAVSETLEMFEDFGIKTFARDNGRIFPVSESSKDVRSKFLNKLNNFKNIKFIKEKALRIEKTDSRFKVITDMNSYTFDKLVVSTGGHAGYDLIKRLGVSIVNPKPSLVGLVTKQNFQQIMGTVLPDIKNIETGENEDLLFTHFGVSGPIIYKISSLYARKEMPYTLSFDVAEKIEDFQDILNKNPHKLIKNILSDYLPQRFAEFILNDIGIDKNIKAHSINGKIRDKISESIHNFKITVKSAQKHGETVTAGGVDLNKIDSKTMESKEVKNLYFCGEIIDADGFCGGFNLQNCWSTAFVASCGLSQN